MPDVQPSTEIGIVIILIFTSLTNIILQIAQMFFDSRRESQQTKINDLEANLQRALAKIDEQDKKIQGLQSEVFEIKKSEAYYKGRLEALEQLEEQQKVKIEAVNKLVSKTAN